MRLGCWALWAELLAWTAVPYFEPCGDPRGDYETRPRPWPDSCPRTRDPRGQKQTRPRPVRFETRGFRV